MSDNENSGIVTRVVRVLQQLAEVSGDVALGDLAERLALPPSTVHRLLRLLAAPGLVERSAEDQKYRVGREFYRISALVVANTAIKDIARPVLESLAKASSETCMLCVYLPAVHRYVTVDHIRSAHPLGYDVPDLEPSSILWGSSGRSILAFLPPAERDAAMALKDPSPATGAPPPPRARLMAELDADRRAGFVFTQGQRIPGAVGFGAPVFQAGGQVFGSLCVTIPDLRYHPRQHKKILALLLDHTRRLNDILGHRDAAASNATPPPKRRKPAPPR